MMDEVRRKAEPRVAGAGSAAQDPRALLMLARDHARAGRTTDAERIYRRLIADWPSAAEPHRRLGILYGQSGRPGEAVIELVAADRLAPGNPLYLVDLGHAYAAARRPAEAADAYGRALALKPDHAPAHFSLGNLLRTQGRTAEAVESYRRAIAAAPGVAGYHVNLGVTLQEQAAFPEALAALRQAVALDPRSFEAHFNLGVVLAAQRKLDDAAAAYGAALAIQPDAAIAHLNLGTVMQEQDRLEDAMTHFARATELAPELAPAHINLGAVLYETGAFAEAVAAIRRGLALDPQNALTYVNLAQTLQAMGDIAGAEAAFRQALALEPAHTTAKAHWSIALHQAGKWEDAQALLDYSHLIRTCRIERVAGWPSTAAFNAALADYIYRHPTLMRDPPARATQNGSQTLEVLNSSDPPVAALQSVIESEVGDYVEKALRASQNPFAPPPPEAWHLHGWAVVLRASGYQIPHFHPEAVVSGVYYVQVPPVVKGGEAGDAGYIKFGPPLEDTPQPNAVDTPLTNAIKPEEGMMLLFPSYFWHHTVPFIDSADRICIAFDVIAERRK